MKKVFVVMMICAALMLAACDGGSTTPDVSELPVLTPDTVSDATEVPASEATPEAKADITVNEIYSRITSGVQFPANMVTMDDDYFINQFGFELSKFDEYIFAVSDNALLAEGIVIIKVKDEADIESVKAKLNEYVTEEITVLNDYLPEQGKIAEKSVVDSNGRFAYMIMSSKVSEVKDIVTDALK